MIEEPARTSLQALDKKDPTSHAGILRALQELRADPKVQISGVQFTMSHAVAILRQERLSVRRLKGFDFKRYRVFYFVDQVRGTVVVKEIIPRATDTYDPQAPHIDRLRKNYLKYHLFQGRARQ